MDSETSLANASEYSIGNHDSIPSRKNPTTMMQTKTVKMPELLRTLSIFTSLSVDFSSQESVVRVAFFSTFASLGRIMLIASVKITMEQTARMDAVVNTACQLI